MFKQLATTKGSADDDYKRIIAACGVTVGPDFQAWQLLVATTDQLDKEILHHLFDTYTVRPRRRGR